MGDGGHATSDAASASDSPTRDADRPDVAVDAAALGECDAPGLVWRSGAKTNYESYPAPGSDECVIYHGCDYLGQFAACANTMPMTWVEAHDIVAVFPLGDLALHRLCLRSGARSRIVTVIDTCADTDCSGCCTTNRGTADALIDVEHFTDVRFGVDDGPIEWADLGPGDPAFDGCN